MSKKYRGKLSFDLAGLQEHNSLNIGLSGISMPKMVLDETTKKTFEGYSAERLSFGWGGNDPKFYGDANKDIMPKPEDFVEVPFRLISATIVGGGTWKATDFSNTAILKKSRSLLDGKTVYKDHETDTDNWVGLVNGVKWSESFTSNGIQVPAGIDGIIAIDKVTNPKVARGAAMGTIYSNSVTVEFDWEMSHKFENEWDFYNKIGTMGADGKMIRRIATAIYNYHETSLVWLGADPFAKAYGSDNELKNIDIGSIYKYSKVKPPVDNEFTEDVKTKYTTGKSYSVGLGFDKSMVALSAHAPIPDTTKINHKMNKEFLVAFIATFGKELNITEADAENMTTEQFTAHCTALAAKLPTADNLVVIETVSKTALAKEKLKDPNATTVNNLGEFVKGMQFLTQSEFDALQENAQKVTTLTSEKETLEREKTELTAEAQLGKTYLNNKKAEAIKLYKTAVGDKQDEAVIELFNKADAKAIDGLLKQYTKSATERFKGHCAKCGSDEFDFKSSLEIDGPETPAVKATDVSFDTIYRNAIKEAKK